MNASLCSTSVLRYSLGIDVSKDNFNACLCSLQQDLQQLVVASATFDNHLKGFRKLLTWLHKHCVDKHAEMVVVMEASGVYHEQLAYFLDEHGKQLCVLLANRVKAYARSLEYKSKTDAIDAQVLARLGLERNLPKWQAPSEALLQLKQLMRERHKLKQDATRLKNQLHAMKHRQVCNPVVKKLAQTRLKFINDQIKKIDDAVRKLVQQDAELRQNVMLLQSIPGVGLLTALTVLAETNNFALFTSRAQLASYAGYDVCHHESGSSVKRKGRISKKGNVYLRAAMHFPALTAIKYAPEMGALYERIYDRTKVKMKGCVAVQRKLLLLMFTLVKNQQTYQPHYQRQQLLQAI
ncbi:MAG: IS110 family transposase [Saprospiraceae bacterium]|nr:MAG: IS110 family transposase [Saprospiraceae bacterium]